LEFLILFVKEVFVKNKKGERLAGVLDKSKEDKALIILCHGFAGTKEYSLFKTISNELTKDGFSIFRFDFSGNGKSEGVFGEAGLLKESDDLKSVLKRFKKYKKIILIGHSMGGAACILAGNSSKRVKGIITIEGLVLPMITFSDSFLKFSPVVAFGENINEDEIISKIEKVKSSANLSITKRVLESAEKIFERAKNKFLLHDSFFEEAKEADIEHSARKLRKPILIIHGKRDTLIPISHARFLYQHCNEPKKLVLLNHPHSFIIKDEAERIAKEIKEWLNNNEIFNFAK